MQNGKDDRTKGQKRVIEKNGKEETTKKPNQRHKEGYTKASKEIIKHRRKKHRK
jgi:hypothetical protein